MFVPSTPPPELLKFIATYKRFLVAGHKEPDGDCVGSQLVLCSILRRCGKYATPCSAGPFKRSEILRYQDRFTAEITPEMRTDAAVIIVDCSSPDRTGGIEAQIEGLPIAVIDHHATGKPFHAAASYIDPEAPAAVFLIYALVKALGFKPDSEEAELLFLGLCADSGFFRHLDGGSAAVFLIASELISAGANPKAAFAAMTGGKSLNSRRLLAAVLSRVEEHFEGRLLISTEEHAETERFGLESRDSDSLYQLLLSIEGVEAVAVIRQESDENCTVGLRSRDAVDVAAIAAVLGGGGHKNAAGLIVKAHIPEMRERLLAAFAACFKG